MIQAPAAAESGVPADSTGSLVDGETELWNDEISALLHSDRKVVASSPAIDDYRFHSDVEAWKSAVHETSAAELANMLDGKGRLDPAMREAIWAQLRYRAGAPSIHEIAHRAGGISQKTVSRIMRGGASNLAPIVKIALVDLLPDGGPE
ncbi:transposase [Streptomyces sp. WAC 04229]|uniref:transposase n=1 Tax=Streptomyces sp. WAC 04229 TaxID=2203206 RepID=UPI003D7109F2